jgi:hypothetical protein
MVTDHIGGLSADEAAARKTRRGQRRVARPHLPPDRLQFHRTKPGVTLKEA